MRGNFVRRTLLALFAATAVLASGVLIAGAATAPKPREMKFACAKNSNGALRYVSRASRCKRTEKAITISDSAPIDVCVRARRTRSLPAGATRFVDAATRCSSARKSKETSLKVPGPKKLWFCALKKTGALRNVSRASRCSKKTELAVFVNKAAPQQQPGPGTPQAQNGAPVARDDAVATGEDTPNVIAPLGNDSDPDGNALSVASVDGTGAAGSVALLPDGTIGYDPNGAFEDLAPGDTETDSFTYRASDGSLQSGPATVKVTIEGANDPPEPQTSSGSASYAEGDPPVAADPGFTVSDVDDANLAGATARITGGFVANEDKLLWVNQNGIGGTYDSGTGVLTLTGTATVAQYQAALRSVKFETAGDGPSPNPRAVEFRVRDADDQSAAVSRPLTVTGVNDAPFVDTSAGTLQYDEGATGTGTEVDPQIDVGDPDSVNLTHATVSVTSPDPADELLFTAQNGITGSYDSGTGVLTLTGTATRAQYRQALRSVRFHNADDTPTTGTRTVKFQVRDGSLDSPATSDTRAVNVRAVNDPPANTTVPGSQAFDEDGSTGFGAAPDFVIADPDSAGNNVTSTLSIGDGAISVGAGSGGTVSGNGTGSVQVTGTVAEVNSRLADVTYTPDANANGNRTLQVLTNDNGHNGSGGSLTDTDTVAISITAINDAPSITRPGTTQTTNEDTPFTFSGVISVSDVDALTTDDIQFTASVLHGKLHPAVAAPGLVVGGDNSGSLTLTGTKGEVNGALDNLTYTPDANYNGPDTLSLHADDQGKSPAPAQTADASVAITVTAVNDAPVVTTTAGSTTFTEGDSAKVVDSGLTVSDVENDTISGATAKITAGYANDASPADHDTLDCTSDHGITCTFDASSGTLTLSGTASTGDYQDVLRSVTFHNDSQNSSAAARTVTFKATDTGTGTPTSAGADKGVSVVRVDDPPVAVGDSATVTEDDPPTTIDVRANDQDVDGGAYLIAGTTDPAHGTVTVVDNDVSYAPDPNYCNSQSGGSPDTFTYELNGGSTATVSVTVTCVDDAPVAVDDTVTVTEDDPATAVDVLANDADVDAGPKTVQSASDPAHGTVVVTGGGTGLTYQPDPNYCNSVGGGSPDNFTYTLNGGSTATVSVTVTCQDDPPVAVGDSATVTEDDPPTTIDVRANDQDVDGGPYLIAGTTDPAHGTATVVDNDVSYQPDANYCNTQTGGTPDTFTYELNGGSTATVSVTVTCVPEPPVLTQPEGTLDYAEGDGEVAVAPALTVADPDDAQLQSATVQMTGGFQSGEDHLLFADQNGITATGSGTGSLTLTGPASVADWQTALRSVRYTNSSDTPNTDTRTVSFQVSDSDGPSNTVTRDIDVTPVNDAPVADSETFDGTSRAVGNTSLVVNDPSDGAPSVSGPKKTVTGDILAGDTDAEGDAVSVVPETVTTHDGGSVTLEDDGDFIFRPARGCSDHSDSFDYHATDGQDAGTGTVTIEVQDCVWYADATAAVNGNGTSNSPFKTLNSLNGFDANVDGPGDTLYLAGGTYSGGLPLENNQRLDSRRHGLVMPDGGAGTVTLDAALPAGPASQINGGLVLADDNDVQGIELGSAASNFALRGTSVGAAHVNDTTAGLINNPDGGAIKIDGPADSNDVAIAMTQTTSGAGNPEAIDLVNVAGTLNLGSGTLSNASGNTVALDGGDADFTYNGAISDDEGRLVDIRNKTGGTNDFNGAVSNLPLQATDDAGGGISLQSNDTLIRFDGGLTLGTGTANAVVGTSGGRLAITGDHNTITTNQGGSALALAFTDIDADGLNFESLSTKNANPGVSLQSTGAAGHLTVTGNAAGDAGSGGTIQNSVGRGIFLDTVPDGVDLNHMNVTGGGDDGVRALDVGGLDVSDSTVSNNGNATGERGFEITAGTTSLNNVTVSGSRDDGVEIDAGKTSTNQSQLATATVSNSTIFGPVSPGLGEGIELKQTFNGVIRATLDGNAIEARAGSGIIVGSDGLGSVRAVVTGNSVQGTPGFAQNGMLFNQNDASRLDATVKGNFISGPGSGAGAGLRAAGATDGTICLDAGDPTDAAQKNSLAGSGGATATDIVVNQQVQSRFILPGYTGASNDTTAVANYLKARNDGGATPSATATFANPPGYVNGTCLLP